MCGIVGILHKDRERSVERHLLERMTDVMSYRGPNDRGIYVNGNIGLGHRRLSIIDLKTGHQPMVDSQGGKVIVYNGEAYNYEQLGKEILEGRGIPLYTSCDTEVVLKMANLDALEWIELLNGMFAFAIWDEKRKTLLLARDRLGVKPLYYGDLGPTFLFASEIKPLLMYSGFPRDVNEDRIPEYLAFRSIAGEETFFKKIKQVPAGHALILKPESYTGEIRRYWKEGENRLSSAYADQAKSPEGQFMEIFGDAVRSRLISDVPVGTYNSGGVDSSLVTAIVRSHKEDELHTFSVGFEESTHDERKYSDIVSRMYNTNHHAIVVNKEEYSKEIFRSIWHLEEPINHPHTVQILLLSKIAKEFVTVVLTGEGADEVFGGYPRYNIVKIHTLLKLVPEAASKWLEKVLTALDGRRLLKVAESMGYNEADAVINNSRFVPMADLRRIYANSIDLDTRRAIYNDRCISSGDLIHRLLYYDQRTYLPPLLNRLDKMSMAASIEARVPFLDYRLVEWSYKLESSQKIKWFTNKRIVKQAAEQYLPKEIIYRRKFGFDVPISEWLRSEAALGRYLEFLRDKTFKERGYFDHGTVGTLIDEHIQRKIDHSEILWGLLNLEIWLRLFIDRESLESLQ